MPAVFMNDESELDYYAEIAHRYNRLMSERAIEQTLELANAKQSKPALIGEFANQYTRVMEAAYPTLFGPKLQLRIELTEMAALCINLLRALEDDRPIGLGDFKP